MAFLGGADHPEIVQAGEARDSPPGGAARPASAWHQRLHLSHAGASQLDCNLGTEVIGTEAIHGCVSH